MRLIAVIAIVVASTGLTGARASACHPAGASPFEPPAISADGSLVVFDSTASLVPADTNGTLDVYARDLIAGTDELISVRSDGSTGDRRASRPSVSSDGRFVAFESDASNLTPGDDGHGQTDVFVRDRLA